MGKGEGGLDWGVTWCYFPLADLPSSPGAPLPPQLRSAQAPQPSLQTSFSLSQNSSSRVFFPGPLTVKVSLFPAEQVVAGENLSAWTVIDLLEREHLQSRASDGATVRQPAKKGG